jgi:hypothetical protein
LVLGSAARYRMARIATTILTIIAVEEEKMEKVMLKSLKPTWNFANGSRKNNQERIQSV